MPPFPYYKNKFQPNYFLPLISATISILCAWADNERFILLFFFFFPGGSPCQRSDHGSRKYKPDICVYFLSDEGAMYGFAFNSE